MRATLQLSCVLLLLVLAVANCSDDGVTSAGGAGEGGQAIGVGGEQPEGSSGLAGETTEAGGAGGAGISNGGARSADAGSAGEGGARTSFDEEGPSWDEIPLEDATALAAEPAQHDEPENVLLPGNVSLADWYASNPTLLADIAALAPPPAARAAKAAPVERDTFVSKFTACLEALVADAFWMKPAGSLGEASEPAQQGLAYVFGGKDPSSRRSSLDNVCERRLHGLDCSGLVSNCAKYAGAGFDPNNTSSAHLMDKARWNDKLPSNLKVAVLYDSRPAPNAFGALDSTGEAYESGDAFAWERKNRGIGHVGVFVRAGYSARIAQSNGASGCASNQWDWSATPARCKLPHAMRQALCDANFLSPLTALNPNTGPNKKTFGFMIGHYATDYELAIMRVVNKLETVTVKQVGGAHAGGQIELVVGEETKGPLPCTDAEGMSLCGGDFETDEDVTITAKAPPGTGLQFVKWSGRECSGANASLRFERRLKPIDCEAQFECPNSQSWDDAARRCFGGQHYLWTQKCDHVMHSCGHAACSKQVQEAFAYRARIDNADGQIQLSLQYESGWALAYSGALDNLTATLADAQSPADPARNIMLTFDATLRSFHSQLGGCTIEGTQDCEELGNCADVLGSCGVQQPTECYYFYGCRGGAALCSYCPTGHVAYDIFGNREPDPYFYCQ